MWVALLPRDIQPAVLVKLLGPPIHNMGPCSRPGEDPNVWKQFGPGYLGNSAVPEWVGRLGGKGLWMGDYRGRGRAALLAHTDLAP